MFRRLVVGAIFYLKVKPKKQTVFLLSEREGALQNAVVIRRIFMMMMGCCSSSREKQRTHILKQNNALKYKIHSLHSTPFLILLLDRTRYSEITFTQRSPNQLCC